MTTIASTLNAAMFPPKQRLLDTISAQTSAGTITSADQTTLQSAIEDIDGTLSVDRNSASAETQLDPAQMKSRIDDLIAGEVANGTLTSDRVFELSGPNGAGGIGGPRGPGGPPPGPPPSQSGTSDASVTSDADASSSSTNAGDLLASFIQQLQETQGQGATYAANGQTGSPRLVSALLLNFEV